jgi:hypothetical protein
MNPVALVDRPRSPRSAHRRVRFLQPEEVEALIRAVPADHLGEVERPLYLTAAMTGLRQGELLGLRSVDVDWVASRVRVAESYTHGAFDSPKSHRGRSVPMADRLAGELERHFQRSPWRDEDDLVLPHPLIGHVLDASKLRKRFVAAIARASVHEITFHELRHTFGTQMAAAGAPLRAIQEWMGHADASTTQIYAHYAPDATGGAAFAQKAFGGAAEEPAPRGSSSEAGQKGPPARRWCERATCSARRPRGREPRLHVAPVEPAMATHPDRRQRAVQASCVLIDARARDGEQDGDLVGGQQRFAQVDGEVIGHVYNSVIRPDHPQPVRARPVAEQLDVVSEGEAAPVKTGTLAASLSVGDDRAGMSAANARAARRERTATKLYNQSPS